MTNLTNLYLPIQTIEVPQNNDALLIFDFKDEDGTLLDLTGVLEIEFTVFTSNSLSATKEIEKTMTGSDITVFGNDYQFSVPITATDTQGLTNRLSYHECQVTNSDGYKRTVSAGLFRCEKTYIWSVV